MITTSTSFVFLAVTTLVLLSTIDHHGVIAIRDGNKIVVGCSLTRNKTPLDHVFNSNGKGLQVGLQFWSKDLNDRGGININGTNYAVELEILEDDGTLNVTSENYRTLLADDTVDFLLGSSDFGTTLSVAENVMDIEAKDRLFLGLITTSGSFNENRQSAFTVLPDSATLGHVAMPFLRTAGVSSITYVIQIGPLSTSCDGLIDLASENGVTEYARYTVTNINDLNHIQNWTDVYNGILEHNYDVLVVCGLSNPGDSALEWMLPRMKEVNWTPKMILALPISSWFNFDPEMRHYVTGVNSINENSFRKGDFYGRISDYVELVLKQYPDLETFLHVWAAIGTMGGVMLETAITNAQSLENAQVVSAMKIIDINTFLGRLRFSAKNGQLVEGVMSQFLSLSHADVVGPLLSASSTLVIPMPTWKERVFKNEFGDSVYEWIVLAAVVGSLFVTGLLAVYIVVNKRLLRYSSPLFMVGILVGATMIYVSTLFNTPNNGTTYACHLHNWLLFLGVSIMFGCLFSKSWRVYLIYKKAKTLEPIKVSDVQVGVYVAIFCTVSTILCIAFSAVMKESEVFIVDQYRVSKNYYKCTLTAASNVILALQYGFILVTMLVGSVTAVLIRNVPSRIFAERKIIAFAIYNMTLFMSIAMLVRFTITQSNTREQQYIIHSLCVILSAGLTVVAMVLLSNKIEDKADTVHGSSSVDSQLQTIDHSKQLSDLRKEIKNLNKTIANLQSIVSKSS